MGYQHEQGAELHRYLDRFVEQKKIIEDEGEVLASETLIRKWFEKCPSQERL